MQIIVSMQNRKFHVLWNSNMVPQRHWQNFQQYLFLNQYHTHLLDDVMRVVTYKFTWIPLYAFLIYVRYIKEYNQIKSKK